MKIHEYQGKELFRKYGIAVPRGMVAFTPEEARLAADKLMQETGSQVIVVKSQIHAGGRGKGTVTRDGKVLGRGVKVITSGGSHAARDAAENMLNGTLLTIQNAPNGSVVHKVYIEEGIKIARELYLSMLVDRDSRRIVVMASTEGGMDIEKVAAETPEKIQRGYIDPVTGITGFQARKLGFGLGLTKEQVSKFVSMLNGLFTFFMKEDVDLIEINPLIITEAGEVLAGDAKVSFDENAEFRQKSHESLRDEGEENATELEAKRADISYVALEGNIGCMVNGAGLAMSTMDIIAHCGGKPANFLDVGGGADEARVTKAFSIILRDPDVKGIFVNIFGGIVKCDLIAQGIINATKTLGLKVPVVARLEGTNVELGRKLLAESGLNITPASTMLDGAQKICALVANPS
ncbi:MAG: ADP-forming succinate--CoA ligase subunit beta [Deltaproteobacteria bacterium]|nr:ADP-forming succinate--CoA ligase subunit beta [Deltaproteobacteria bacterium]